MRNSGTGRARPGTDSPDSIFVASQKPVWEVVKEYIEDQIVLGTYPVGSWLPSVRDLSAEIGLNRNTISKAYRALGRDGIVVSKQGVGVLVVECPAIDQKPSARLSSLIATVVEEAKQAGITNEALLQQIEMALARASRTEETTVAFIECSPQDTEKMSHHLARHLGIKVAPVDLSDFLEDSAHYVEAYSVLCTTFFHLQEIAAAVDEYDIEVIGLNHVPSHESILELARIPSDMTIGLICTNQRTVDKVSSVIRMYSRCEIISCIVDDKEALDRVVHQADVLVDTVRAHESVAGREDAPPFITLDFQTEQQSIEYLQAAIHGR